MDVIYGIQIEDGNKHVQEAVAWGQGINQVLEPGRFWVDFLPFCECFVFVFSVLCHL